MPKYNKLPDTTVHDLAIDELCKKLSDKESERAIILHFLSNITDDPKVASYRAEVFSDILRLPAIRERMQKILERIDFLRQFGSFNRDPSAAGVWETVHRMEDMYDYIEAVEAIYETLSEADISSSGLNELRDYARGLYEDSGFSELKKDITEMKKETKEVKSVTLGVNLNDRFEPNSAGIVSINSKYFTKSALVSNFSDFVHGGNHINEDTAWDQNYMYRPGDNSGFKVSEKGAYAMSGNPMLLSMALLLPEDRGDDVLRSMDRAMGHMINKIAAKLRSLTSKYVSVSTAVITGLIPEFMYYIRFAEYIEKLSAVGFKLNTPDAIYDDERITKAVGLYNLRLADDIAFSENEKSAADVIGNDLVFDNDHRLYILTGANRGGKTTFTQALGISYVLAQGGISVPAESFTYTPVDNIFTHYPADEIQTMDLGRLGEETKRFKELYQEATGSSLLLLNESFSTTSFEEGYYIACDVIRALLHKGIRTVYNTHMHKLAEEAEDFARKEGTVDKAVSLVAKTEGSKRSFKIVIAPPEGSSYARDIALKYGVTYEQLMGNDG